MARSHVGHSPASNLGQILTNANSRERVSTGLGLATFELHFTKADAVQDGEPYGQFGCWPWSVSLANPVSCCGDGGQVAGVLQPGKLRRTVTDPKETVSNVRLGSPFSESDGKLMAARAAPMR